MGRIARKWWWGLLLIVLAGVIGRAVWTRRAAHAQRSPDRVRQLLQGLQQDTAALPVYGEAPAFSLTDQQDRPVTREALGGSVWVADFIFTRCAGQCLVMTSQMVELQRRLPSEIRLVSFSVDPAWDTPARLAEYAARMGADGDRWRLVTGPLGDVHRLSREGFHLGVEEQGGPPAEPIIHSVRFVLVDAEGRIRGYYAGTDAEAVRRLERDATRLLRDRGD